MLVVCVVPLFAYARPYFRYRHNIHHSRIDTNRYYYDYDRYSFIPWSKRSGGDAIDSPGVQTLADWSGNRGSGIVKWIRIFGRFLSRSCIIYYNWWLRTTTLSSPKHTNRLRIEIHFGPILCFDKLMLLRWMNSKIDCSWFEMSIWNVWTICSSNRWQNQNRLFGHWHSCQFVPCCAYECFYIHQARAGAHLHQSLDSRKSYRASKRSLRDTLCPHKHTRTCAWTIECTDYTTE